MVSKQKRIYNNIEIKLFNDLYFECDEDNTKIERDIKECKLTNIGQKGFEDFCNLELKNIELLSLNSNSISNIQFLNYFKAPALKKLDLSENRIKIISVFGIAIFPSLIELDLSNNIINDISIFKNDSFLKNYKLRKLFLQNNELDYDDENVQSILENLKKVMIANNKDSSLISGNEQEYINELKNIKTFNDKYMTDFGIFDKDLIKKMKTIEKISKNDIDFINSMEKDLLRIKASIKKTKTLRDGNNLRKNEIKQIYKSYNLADE